MASQAVRSTALRAGGACTRCRKGKTKCVYENGRAPCRNCEKGQHECRLPTESSLHVGVSPARTHQRSRESLPAERAIPSASADRQLSVLQRPVTNPNEKPTPEMLLECERVVSKTLPACVAFHKPSFIQHLKNHTMEPTMVNALLTTAARHSPTMIRRFGGHGGGSTAAEHFAAKTINHVMLSLDQPSLADIQALCLLVVHEWGCRNAVRAYIYLGQAARMAQMYRVVHVSHHLSDPDQFLQEESLRRTIWLIYILDCFLTSSPGRHPALSSHDIKDVSLPCLDMNYNFCSPVYVRTLSGTTPSTMPDGAPLGDIGEYGHIVLATKAWRTVVEMMTTTTLDTFNENQCQMLEQDIDTIRQSLPTHFADKPGQINLHITMGSGFTYAMIHCLLNCGTIFVNRRRILQMVTTEEFNMDVWRMSSDQVQTVDRIFAASHSIIHSLLALEHGADKDNILCFPIFMLFSAFTAGSTVAYLVLKGLAPLTATESAAGIVRDSLRLCHDGAESWPLVVPWQRHLSVMTKVLREVNIPPHDRDQDRDSLDGSVFHPPSPSAKEDNANLADISADMMDCEHPQSAGPLDAAPPPSRTEGRNSEPPPQRRPGVTTINGGSAGASTPATASPPSGPVPKMDSPDEAPGLAMAAIPMAPAGPDVEMTGLELCAAFERQLLELDDLAAFMGGGVWVSP